MEIISNICKDLELECSKYNKSKGNDLIHFLVKDSRKDNSLNMLKEYLDTNPDKINIQNEEGWTPLMIASWYSNTTSTFETVELLLECGANPNLKDNIGHTALMHASINSNSTSTFETVELLLNCGADPNLKNNFGNTALMIPSNYSNNNSNDETVECLLKYNTNPNLQNNDGWTALMNAIYYSSIRSNLKMIELLLEYGADPNLKNKNGENICDKFFQENPQILEKYKKCNEMCNKKEMVSKITEFLNSL